MEIQLSQGKVAIIDDADVALVIPYRWYAIKNRKSQYDLWYAMAKINGHTAYMHRLIMGAPAGKQVDHKDQDGLNNRRSNLRLATPTEQARNSRARRKRAVKHSRFKGIHWHTTKKHTRNGVKTYGRWRAVIQLPGAKLIIRYAKTEEEAVRIYNSLVKEHFGEFAKPNLLS